MERFGPPPAVQREVELAAARAEDLWRDGWELHFEPGERPGRVSVELRDRDGATVRGILPSEALDVMAGRPL